MKMFRIRGKRFLVFIGVLLWCYFIFEVVKLHAKLDLISNKKDDISQIRHSKVSKFDDKFVS